MQRAHYRDLDSLVQLEDLATPLWIFDVARHAMWWGNRAALAFWDANDLTDLQARDFSSDSDAVRTRLKQIARDAQAGGVLRDTWTLYPSGRPRSVVLSIRPVIINDNTPALMLEVSRILDLAADEDAIRMLEAARASAFPISTFALDGTLLSQNPAALACYGKVVPGRVSLKNRISDQAVVSKLMQSTSDNTRQDIEASVVTRQGARIHRLQGRRGRDPITGDVVLVLSEEDITDQMSLRRGLQDLTGHLEAQVAERTRRLRESEERYELATRTAAIWDWSNQYDYQFISKRFIEALGFTPGQFHTRLNTNGPASMIHPEDQDMFKAKIVAHLKAPDSVLDFDARVKHASGAFIWFNFRGVSITDDNGYVIRSGGLLTDINARKELEATLFAAQRLEAVGQLTGGIAHDFNNLLTVVGGNAELLALSERVDTELLDAIRDATARGADLTRHLLAFSRKQTLQPRPIDLHDLFARMRRSVLRVLGDGVDIRFDLPSALPHVLADPTQLESAVLNLAINARDAMAGTGVLTIRGTRQDISPGEDTTVPRGLLLDPGRYVALSVTDTGSGMDADTRARAFEPFFSTKGVGEGSGLGLSMVLGFSRQSGGAAHIASEPGQGTTVTLYLPRSETRAETSDHQPKVPATALRTTSQPLFNDTVARDVVFLLEDDSNVQDTMSHMLNALNYQVRRAACASEAELLLHETPRPCAYLLDVLLPGGRSGVEFAEQILEFDPAARILFVSGHPRDELPCAPDLSAQNFLQKPFTVQALSDALTSVLHLT